MVVGGATQGRAAMAETGKVRVGVRVRPLLPREQTLDAPPVISHPSEKQVLVDNNPAHRFTYDHVFPVHASQRDLYASTAAQMLQPFLDVSNDCAQQNSVYPVQQQYVRSRPPWHSSVCVRLQLQQLKTSSARCASTAFSYITRRSRLLLVALKTLLTRMSAFARFYREVRGIHGTLGTAAS